MRRNIFTVIIILVFIIGFGMYKNVANKQSDQPSNQQPVHTQTEQESKIGRIGEGYFSFEIADDVDERTKGLSNRDTLPDTDALLFVFDLTDKHCFWMKNMKFNIDILWFDTDKKLVYEKRNVSPATYPESFCPDVPTKYVVEVTAGVADKNQIKLGSLLAIEL